MLDFQQEGLFSMRYTKEFKLECVKKYKSGKRIDDPGGCKHATFMRMVRLWAAIYDSLGEDGLEHRTSKRTWQDKFAMVQRVLGGESASSVANSNGIGCDLLSKWRKIYLTGGIDGLKSSDRKGRPPKMTKKPKPPNGPKTMEELELENEELRAENEYLKKLNALVQGRKDRRPKRK